MTTADLSLLPQAVLSPKNSLLTIPCWCCITQSSAVRMRYEMAVRDRRSGLCNVIDGGSKMSSTPQLSPRVKCPMCGAVNLKERTMCCACLAYYDPAEAEPVLLNPE